MVPKIWSVTDRICCHFGPFFAFDPINNPKNQNFEKPKKKTTTKKTRGVIVILPKCTKNHDHMLDCSLDMTSNGFNCYFSFWAIFYLFTSLIAQKIKIQKKCEKPLEISSFYNSVPKIMIICYTVHEIWCVTDVVIFHFGPFFPLLPPNSQKN